MQKQPGDSSDDIDSDTGLSRNHRPFENPPQHNHLTQVIAEGCPACKPWLEQYGPGRAEGGQA